MESQLTAKTQECSDLWEANRTLSGALVEYEKERDDFRDANSHLKAALESRKSQLEADEEVRPMWRV